MSAPEDPENVMIAIQDNIGGKNHFIAAEEEIIFPGTTAGTGRSKPQGVLNSSFSHEDDGFEPQPRDGQSSECSTFPPLTEHVPVFEDRLPAKGRRFLSIEGFLSTIERATSERCWTDRQKIVLAKQRIRGGAHRKVRKDPEYINPTSWGTLRRHLQQRLGLSTARLYYHLFNHEPTRKQGESHFEFFTRIDEELEDFVDGHEALEDFKDPWLRKTMKSQLPAYTWVTLYQPIPIERAMENVQALMSGTHTEQVRKDPEFINPTSLGTLRGHLQHRLGLSTASIYDHLCNYEPTRKQGESPYEFFTRIAAELEDFLDGHAALEGIKDPWLRRTMISQLPAYAWGTLYQPIPIERAMENVQTLMSLTPTEREGGKPCSEEHNLQQQAHSTSFSSSQSSGSGPSVKKKTSAQGEKNRSQTQKKLQCFNCGKWGHYARQCKSARTPDPRATASPMAIEGPAPTVGTPSYYPQPMVGLLQAFPWWGSPSLHPPPPAAWQTPPSQGRPNKKKPEYSAPEACYQRFLGGV
ncbi:uncharacterized protein [Palaemon carinicauda]|uniref:uncharacterized protein n=1 Tax=Palaemon carinicauda TaxID=392227 RepID=UPI0035B64505